MYFKQPNTLNSDYIQLNDKLFNKILLCQIINCIESFNIKFIFLLPFDDCQLIE